MTCIKTCSAAGTKLANPALADTVQAADKHFITMSIISFDKGECDLRLKKEKKKSTACENV